MILAPARSPCSMPVKKSPTRRHVIQMIAFSALRSMKVAGSNFPPKHRERLARRHARSPCRIVGP
eukprot:6366621-Pyramimonas_sp.AAC.1